MDRWADKYRFTVCVEMLGKRSNHRVFVANDTSLMISQCNGMFITMTCSNHYAFLLGPYHILLSPMTVTSMRNMRLLWITLLMSPR